MKDLNSANQTPTISKTFAASAQRVLTVDVERYQSYLDGMDVSDERKEEFLRAMFSIVMTFVDLGFSVHPLQEVCGKERIEADRLSKTSVDEVGLGEPTQSSTKDSGPSGSLGIK